MSLVLKIAVNNFKKFKMLLLNLWYLNELVILIVDYRVSSHLSKYPNHKFFCLLTFNAAYLIRHRAFWW